MSYRVSVATENGDLLSLLSFQDKKDAEKYVDCVKRDCIRREEYYAINMFEV